ncbi:MAG: hypothetical protein QGG53_06010 [Planctomycetota bacterium]|nr:hypothetical protein [Planctomycetota bacterium]
MDGQYLLIDKRIVDHLDNARLVLGKAKQRGDIPLLPTKGYTNVLYDEEEALYKTWYFGNGGFFYAFSGDGLNWEKPRLGLFELDGSKDNNMVHASGATGVIKDLRDPDPARRYKLIFKSGARSTPEDRQKGRHRRLWMWMSYSPDGIHWTNDMETEMPLWRGAHGDTHNQVFWDERIGKYVIIFRLWNKDHKLVGGEDSRRIVGRMESDDCRSWSFPTEILSESDEENWKLQIHDMGVFPYADQYIGLLAMQPGGPPLSRTTELAWSHDGLFWHRVCPGEQFLPTGPEEGRFGKTNAIPVHLPIVEEDQIRFYYVADGGLSLAVLRPDGFAGIAPVDTRLIGTVETRYLKCTDRNLHVNVDATNGSMRVSLISHSRYDEEGRLEFDDCEPITGDVVDGTVKWRGLDDLSYLIDNPVRLVFELKGATLYSFRFGP